MEMSWDDTRYEMVTKDNKSIHVMEFADRSVELDEFLGLLMTMDARIAMMEKLTEEALIAYANMASDQLATFDPITNDEDFAIQILIPELINRLKSK